MTYSIAILFAALLPFSDPPQPKLTPQQQQRIEQLRATFEPHRQTALRLNDMAASIHSKADAMKLVDGIENELFGHRDPLQSRLQSWITRAMRRRIAHAEFAAVSNPSNLFPEQRIVDVWNQYVREIAAPEETLVTVAEVHNLRDGMYTGSQRMWSRGGYGQSIWMMPRIYALDADGRVATGCRAIEALKILHDMEYSFLSVKSAPSACRKACSFQIWFSTRGRTQPSSRRPFFVCPKPCLLTRLAPAHVDTYRITGKRHTGS